MTRRCIAHPLLLAVGLLAALTTAVVVGVVPPVQATIVVRMDLDEMTEAADVIAAGTVVASDSHWSQDGRTIVTDVTVEVADGLKNCAAGDRVTVRTPGGSVDGISQVVAGAPGFALDERVVVFLSRVEGRDELGLLGLGQGKYTVAHTAQSPDVEVAIPALDGLTLAEVEVTPDPSAPDGVRRTVRALDVPADLEPIPAADLVEQIRAHIDDD